MKTDDLIKLPPILREKFAVLYDQYIYDEKNPNYITYWYAALLKKKESNEYAVVIAPEHVTPDDAHLTIKSLNWGTALEIAEFLSLPVYQFIKYTVHNRPALERFLRNALYALVTVLADD